MPEKNENTEAPQKSEVHQQVKTHHHKSGPLILLLVFLIFLTIVGFGLIMGGRFMHPGFRAERENFRTNLPMMEARGGKMGRNIRGERNGITGKVTAVSDKKFTVDASGTSYDVLISDATRFPISSTTTVKVGDTVRIIGAKDSTGVVQAAVIVVNP